MYSSLRITVLAAGLALATATYADVASLDPENFIDPRQEETFAMIAQELQAMASASSTILLLDETMTSLTPAVIVIAAAPSEIDLAAGFETATAEAPFRNNEMETLAALAPQIAGSDVETTGSLADTGDRSTQAFTIGEPSDDYMP